MTNSISGSPPVFTKVSGSFSEDGTLTIPAGSALLYAVARETAGRPVGNGGSGQFLVGTTAGGTEVVTVGSGIAASAVVSTDGLAITFGQVLYPVDTPIYLQVLKHTITGITQANPAVVTAASHGFANGDIVKINGVVGMTEVNGLQFTVAGKTLNTFQLSGVDSTAYTAYASGGTAQGWNGANVAFTLHIAQYD